MYRRKRNGINRRRTLASTGAASIGVVGIAGNYSDVGRSSLVIRRWSLVVRRWSFAASAYSASATIGSILVARRAGRAHAAMATTARIIATAASTSGSVAL